MLCATAHKSFTQNKRLFRADAKKRLFKGCLSFQSHDGLFYKMGQIWVLVLTIK